eukprot:11928948-Prorocentrum_lima.AAC.1
MAFRIAWKHPYRPILLWHFGLMVVALLPWGVLFCRAEKGALALRSPPEPPLVQHGDQRDGLWCVGRVWGLHSKTPWEWLA